MSMRGRSTIAGRQSAAIRAGSRARRWLAGLAMLALASCVAPSPRPPPRPPAPPAAPADALAAGIRPGPPLPPLDPVAAARSLDAFLISCPSLTARADRTGLAAPGDWAPACAAAADAKAAGTAQAFFRDSFETVQVGDGAAFATGYYEPEISASRTRQPGYEVPIYARPDDLLAADPRTGARGRGRVDENGDYVLYYDRGEIEDGALAGRGLEIAWAADPVALFFLQIQGSGRLRLPDGGVMRIGYADQNGRDYVAIGRLLRERNLIEGPIGMRQIVDWLHAHPVEGDALMRENRSYVFFRALTGPGPLGALGRPVTPGASVAADPAFVPLGAPVLLAGMDNPRADGLWIAQDTGGAIRGANRFDTFWGAGPDAAATAGSMQSHGRAYILVPRGTLARLRRDGPAAQR
jgi:membrane-bound lytic murein transglycosylase A